MLAFGFCFFCTGPAPQAFNFQGRAPRAEEARVLYWNWPARLLPGWVPVGTRRAPAGAAGGNFAGLGLEEANLVVREGVWVENADFGITLVHLRLVERSILVYGKWGQFGHLGGARRGMSFA